MFWGLFAGVFSQGINFLNNVILSRILDTQMFASLVVITSNIGFIQNFTFIGLIALLPIIVSRLQEDNRIELKNFVNNSGRFILLNSILLVSGSIFINQYYNYWQLGFGKDYFFVFVWNVLSTLDLFLSAILSGLKEFKKLAIYSFFKGLSLLSLSYFLSIKLGLSGALIANCISLLLCVSICLFFTKDLIKFRIRNWNISQNYKGVQQYLKKSFPIFIASIVMLPAQWGINQFLAYHKEYMIISIFGIIYPWLIMIQFLPMQITKVILPFISNKNADNKKIVNLGFITSVFLSAFFILILIIFSKYILSFYTYSFQDLQIPFLLIIFTSLFSIVNVYIGQLLLVNDLYWLRAKLDTLISLLIIVTFVFSYYSGQKNNSIFIAYFVSFFINMLIMFYIRKAKRI